MTRGNQAISYALALAALLLAQGCGSKSKHSGGGNGGPVAGSDEGGTGDAPGSQDATPGAQAGGTGGEADGGGGEVPVVPTRPTLGVLNFRQYVATLSQLTGVQVDMRPAQNNNNNQQNQNPLAAAVTTAMTSLPQNSDPTSLGMSAQKAMFTLAAAFCGQAVQNANRGKFLPGYNFGTQLTSAQARETLADKLMERFFLVTDPSDYADDPTLDAAKQEILMTIEDVRGTQTQNADVNAIIGACITAGANVRVATY